MKGCWYRISCLFIAFCFFLALPSVVYASKIDNMFEAIIGNAFLKVGKKIDNLSVLRKGDNFSSILRKNDDLVGLIKRRKLVDDDVLGLRKIGFPPGSRYVDEFMSLSKTERAIGYSLDDTVSKIARLQNGDDIVKKLGKKGLLSSGIYGDEFAKGAYAIAKQDEVWKAGQKSIRLLDQDNGELIRRMQKQNFPDADYGSLRRISNLDPIDLSTRVMRTYGPRGLESLQEFLRKVWGFMKENPKKSTAGILVAMVYVNPSLILDPVGRLKDNAVDGLLTGLSEMGGEVVAGIATVPLNMGRGFTKRIFPDGPVFIKSTLSYIMASIFFMAFFYAVPFTRFIPRKIFSWLCSIRIPKRKKPEDV